MLVIGSGIPVFNPLLGRFSGGIRTQFRSFPTSKYYAARPSNDDSSETDENYGDDYVKENDKMNYRYKERSRKYEEKKTRKTYKPKTSTTGILTQLIDLISIVFDACDGRHGNLMPFTLT